MKAVIVTGAYKSIRLGEVLEVSMIDTCSVMFKDKARAYAPAVCVCVDDKGNRLNMREAIQLFRKERKNG